MIPAAQLDVKTFQKFVEKIILHPDHHLAQSCEAVLQDNRKKEKLFWSGTGHLLARFHDEGRSFEAAPKVTVENTTSAFYEHSICFHDCLSDCSEHP